MDTLIEFNGLLDLYISFAGFFVLLHVPWIVIVLVLRPLQAMRNL